METVRTPSTTTSASPRTRSSLPQPLDLAHPLAVGGGGPPGASPGGEITLAAGLYVQRISAAGLTVAQIRDRFRARMSIEDRAVAVINGVEVTPDTTLLPGQTLTFVRRAGERG